jgi:hypothetical protein
VSEGKMVLHGLQKAHEFKEVERVKTAEKVAREKDLAEAGKRPIPKGSSKAMEELKAELHEKSQQLVEQGQQLLEVTAQFCEQKNIAVEVRGQIDTARQILLKDIAGEHVDFSKFSNVSIPELVRIRLAKIHSSEVDSLPVFMRQNASASAAPTTKEETDPVTSPATTGSDSSYLSSIISNTGSSGAGAAESLAKMEKEMQKLRGVNKKLQNRAEQLEGELKLAVAAMDDVRAIKTKTAELAAKQRTEKELRQRSEEATSVANEKIALLTEHIEKLMTHLKHEAAAKSKAHNNQKETEKEISILRDRNTALVRKNAGRERIINELKEGSKILEDQLRLMDEKYIELRSKLDWTRSQSQREVKKIQSEANALRAKWALAVDQGAMPPSLGGMQVSKSMGAIEKKTKSGNGHTNQSDVESRGASPSYNGLRPSSTSSDLNGTLPLPAVDGLDASLPWSDAKISSLHENAAQKRKQKERM